MAPVEWYGSFIYGGCVPYAPGIYLSSVLGKDTTRQFLLWFKVQGRYLTNLGTRLQKKKNTMEPRCIKKRQKRNLHEVEPENRKTIELSRKLEDNRWNNLSYMFLRGSWTRLRSS